MLKAILFDLDGTLVNTDPLHFATWQDVLNEFGMEIDQVFYNKYISGRHNSEIVQDILPQLSLEEGLQLAAAKEARFRELGAELQPLTGLEHVLEWSKTSRLKQAVVTNAPRANADFLLEILQLTGVFPTIVLAEDAPAGKPDPAPYQLALTRLNVDRTEAIAFEDSPSGILSATGAGLFTIGVASTHNPEHLARAGAEMVINDFTDEKLWQFLNRNN